MTILGWARLCRRSLPVWLAGALFSVVAAAAGDDPYLDAEQAFRGSVQAVDGAALNLRFDVAPGYHLYRDRIGVAIENGDARLGAIDLPAGTPEFDEATQKNLDVLRGSVVWRVPVEPGKADFHLRVSYQGCADRGLCYAPQTALVAVSVQDGRMQAARWLADAGAATAATPGGVESALRSGRWLTIAGVFLLAGLLLSFTPCVLPMVPILSSIIVGQGAPVSRRRGFTLALAYALGMALVYTVFGVIAGLLGEGLAAALQNPWVLGAFALLLAGLALAMFGAFELQMPTLVQSRLSDLARRLPGGRYAAVFLMGGLSALIVGPCVAAPLAGALVFISQTRDVVIGGLALFSLAMGMSLPLLLVGVSAGSLLPRAGAWMQGVKTFFGVLLLAVALWIVAPVLPVAAVMLTIGVGSIVGAVYLRLFDALPLAASGARRLGRGAALVLALLGALQIVGALSGAADPLQPLAHLARNAGAGAAATSSGARTSVARLEFRRVRTVAELDAALSSAGRPVVLDFYADWCVSCKEMEHLTFSDPAVRARLAPALLLQADVTANAAADQALLKRFGLFGPPGVLFFDSAGQERSAARVVGYLPPADFSLALTAAGL